MGDSSFLSRAQVCRAYQNFQRVALVLIFCLNIFVNCSYDIDDAVLYRVSFNDYGAKTGLSGDLNQPEELKLTQYSSKIVEPEESRDDPKKTITIPDHSEMKLKRPDLPEDEDDQLDKITMLSRHGEKYVCTIPRTDDAAKQKGGGKDGYEGQTALALLEPLFVSQSCAYRLEHYWTYELCHGRFLRQYHEERDGKQTKLDEYFLGKYDTKTYQSDIETVKEQLKSGKIKKPQKKRVETMNMPYLELKMTGGTVCDLNGLPRMARVQYVCYPSGKHEMYSFKETSTCEYEVMVLSPLLCSHPDYRPESANEQHINCQPADKETSTKPQDLVRTEKENYKMLTKNKMYEADFFQGTKGPGSVKIEIKPVNPFGAKTPVDAEEKDDGDSKTDDSRWRESKREPVKPLSDPQIVRDFLMGDHCLYGGTGWWKYEFCYGKTVKQYHEEKGERAQLINLGHFDKSKHIQWLKENPSKVPKTAEFRKHVSHFYSDGDFCELSGKPRQIEVKLKCKPSQSISAVTLYLLEPKTCEYILGVESPLICDILNRADENGIMEVYPTIDKELVTDDETLDELVEKASRSDSSSSSVPQSSPPSSVASSQSELKAKAESIRTKIILGDVDSTPKNENSYPSPLSDDREQTSKGNYISKEELINDINDMLKLKINGKIVQKLDVESLKKLSKGKLTEILKEAQGDKSLMEKASNIHEGLKNLRFKHHAEDDNGDQLESDEADYNDGSTDYDDDLDEDE